MNTGAISSRYARALLLYVKERGAAQRVCAQIRSILEDRTVPERLEPELETFLLLVHRNGRMEFIRFILTSFVRLYLSSEGIVPVRIITAVPSDDLTSRIQAMLEKRLGCKTEVTSSADSSILGGFVAEVGDNRLDASVKGALDKIKKSLNVA